jgi:hypothetical protein
MSNSRQISETDKLKRTSRQAAFISGLGALIIFGALLFGSLRLQNLTGAINKKKTEVAKLEEQHSNLEKVSTELKEEIKASQTQIEVLRNQKNELTSAIQEDRSVPITAVVKPRASVRPLTPEEAQRYSEKYKYYEFWMEIPEDKKGDIVGVTYYMNHPTFPQPNYIGRGEDFRASYYGWGALTNVIVTITLRDGTQKKIDFNQYAAIYGN